MATICFGPPPLPPNKKSLLSNNGLNRNRKHSHGFLSSTYHSFRDPVEENEFIVMASEDIELAECPPRATVANGGFEVMTGKRSKKVTHTNSLIRSKGEKITIVRSHSDGNLHKKKSNAPMTINKYIKVLSGSWKNLLNRKFPSMSQKDCDVFLCIYVCTYVDY